MPTFFISGPVSFSPTTNITTSTTSGIPILTLRGAGRIGIDPNYVDGTPIVSDAIFTGTLATLGFTTPGLIASWQLDGVTGDAGRIDLVVGPPATASVPGPLPLFGAAAA